MQTAITQARSNPSGSRESLSGWKQVLSLDPTNLEAHIMLGWELMQSDSSSAQEMGMQLLEKSFYPSKVSPTIDFNFPQTYMIAATIGRDRSQKKEYRKARKFTKIALELSKRHGNPHYKNGDVCVQMQLGTMLNYFPGSTDAADAAISSLTAYTDRLLEVPGWSIDDAEVSKMPGGANDPYVHCSLSMFYLSFYYRADVAAVASRHYELARRAWPALNTTAEFVKRYDEQEDHPCVDRKIRLAVVAATLSEGHSNSESFRGILSHLDRNIFEVTYIYLVESSMPNVAKFTKIHSSDRTFIWQKKEQDLSNGAWTTRLGKTIEEMEMDIIFYFDLTMSGVARRLGMQRLAPVQLNSPGHPITSGHDRSIINYYVSWAASELPLEQAQTHYTEELKLVPADTFFQYYEKRILPGNLSRMDGQAFGHLRRSDFGLPEDEDTHIFLCMQQPFKFHPEFDPLICGILENDPNGIVVLRSEDSPANQAVFKKRLERAGCNLDRVHFLDQQPHHRLLALYHEATVVLDSYPAGGDTTTREVLELGKPLVTLPTRLLGGRWTLGYLNNIGLNESTKKALIASTPEEYVNLAVRLATDTSLRESVEADIEQCAPNLFHRDEAVEAWQTILLEISPVQQCQQQAALDRKEEL